MPELPYGRPEGSESLFENVFRDEQLEVVGLAMPEVETNERGTSAQKEPLLLPEEGLEHLALKVAKPTSQGGPAPATGGARIPRMVAVSRGAGRGPTRGAKPPRGR